MDKKEFSKIITEMQNFYGKRLNPQEMEVYFNELKFMPVKRFSYLVGLLYKQNKFLPKLSEILDLHKEVGYKQFEEDKETKTVIKTKCYKCNGSGYVPYWKEINGNKYQYWAVCDCGRQSRYDGTKVENIENKSKYYIPTMQEMNIEISEKPTLTKEGFKNAVTVLNNKNFLNKNMKDHIRQIYAKLK